MPISIGIPGVGVDDTIGAGVETDVICIGVGVGVGMMEVCNTVQGVEELDGTGIVARAWCRWDKNSVSSLPIEPCFDVPNNSLNHLFNSLFLWLEKLTKKSSNQTTYLFSCQTSL